MKTSNYDNELYIDVAHIIHRRLLTLIIFLLLSPVAQAQITIAPGGISSIGSGGSSSLGCSAIGVQGTLNLAASRILNAGDVLITSTGVFNAGQSSIDVSGSWANNGSFVAGSSTVVFSDTCAAGTIQISGTTTFNNLTLSSNSARTFYVAPGSNITVNGVLSLQGSGASPIKLSSSNGQLVVINLGPLAQVIYNNVSVSPSVQIGAGAGAGAMAAVPTLDAYGMLLLVLSLILAALHRNGVQLFKKRPSVNQTYE